MNIQRIIIATVLFLALATCIKVFGWVPPTEAAETTLPVINAEVNGTVLVTSTSNHVILPATITFTADKPVTIYYTTNGTDPTTATTTLSRIEADSGTATGPTINSIDSVLMTIGEDRDGNLTSVQSYTFFSEP